MHQICVYLQELNRRQNSTTIKGYVEDLEEWLISAI